MRRPPMSCGQSQVGSIKAAFLIDNVNTHGEEDVTCSSRSFGQYTFLSSHRGREQSIGKTTADRKCDLMLSGTLLLSFWRTRRAAARSAQHHIPAQNSIAISIIIQIRRHDLTATFSGSVAVEMFEAPAIG